MVNVSKVGADPSGVRPGRSVTCSLPGCGRDAADTVEFALDGTKYEIDLCLPHAEDMRDDIEEFVGPGRPATSGPAPRVAATARAARGHASPREVGDARVPEQARRLGSAERAQARARHTADRLRAAGEATATRRREAALTREAAARSQANQADEARPDQGRPDQGRPDQASGTPDPVGPRSAEPAGVDADSEAVHVLRRVIAATEQIVNAVRRRSGPT